MYSMNCWHLRVFTIILLSKTNSKFHSGSENLKKVQAKKLVKSNKSISPKCFGQIWFFAISEKAKKTIFEIGKSLKLPKMQSSRKKFLVYSISLVFLPGLL